MALLHRYYFCLVFGIAFILNMLLRSTWLMALVYPVVVILIIDDVSFWSYFSSPIDSFSRLPDRITSLEPFDLIVLLAGLAGTIVAGYVIKILRNKGYQMF
nr:YuiB family protein [Piscibacillus salipiscarius]